VRVHGELPGECKQALDQVGRTASALLCRCHQFVDGLALGQSAYTLSRRSKKL
jgi:hypothetical protein